MSDVVQVAVITGLAAAIPSTIIALATYRKAKHVEHATNSMKDAMVASARIEGHAAGVASEKHRAGGGSE